MRTSAASRLLAFALALGWLCTSSALAQNGQNQQKETLKAQGTIKAMAPGGLIQMVSEDGEEWVIKVEPRATVSYYAAAEPNWLKPGMLVRFSGRFDNQGRSQGTTRNIAVVTLSEEVRPGIKVDVGLTAGEDLFSDEKPADAAAAQPQTVAADVVGTLKTLKDGEFVVAAPGAAVRGTLDEKAVVSVEMQGMQMAQVGDSIEVNGWYPPGVQGRALANRVTIRAKEPLKGWVKPPPRTKAGATPAPEDDPLNGPK